MIIFRPNFDLEFSIEEADCKDFFSRRVEAARAAS